MKNIILILVLFFQTTDIIYGQSMIYIGSGASVYTTGTAFITLQNAKLMNDGTFTANNGNVLINGNAPTNETTIEGSGSTDFYNLTINKSSNGLKLIQNIRVNGTLQFVHGLIHTNGNNIKCGTTSGASSSSYIVID